MMGSGLERQSRLVFNRSFAEVNVKANQHVNKSAILTNASQQT